MSEDKNVPWQNKTVMLVAVVVAVVAVVLNYMYVSGIENKTEEQQVVVWRAKETLQAGRMITEEDVEKGKIPAPTKRDAEPFVLAEPKSEFASIKNKRLRRRVDKGEPIRWDMFTEAGGEQTAEDNISNQWRAVTIFVDGRTANPLVRPGSKIDLHAMLQNMSPDGRLLAPTMELMLEDVEVLAVGAVWKPELYQPGRSGGNYTQLTILVPNSLVSDLVSIIKLTAPPVMVLRNPTDTTRGKGSVEWEISARPRLENLRKKAQEQKIPFDKILGIGIGNNERL